MAPEEFGRDRKFYFCPLCEYKSESQRSLKRHVNSIHTRDTTYVCHLCGEVKYRKDHLRRHIARTHEGAPAEKKLCLRCEKGFNRKEELFAHLTFRHRKRIHPDLMEGLDQDFIANMEPEYFRLEAEETRQQRQEEEGEDPKPVHRIEKQRTEKHEIVHEGLHCILCGESALSPIVLRDLARELHPMTVEFRCPRCSFSTNDPFNNSKHARQCRDVNYVTFVVDSQVYEHHTLACVEKNLSLVGRSQDEGTQYATDEDPATDSEDSESSTEFSDGEEFLNTALQNAGHDHPMTRFSKGLNGQFYCQICSKCFPTNFKLNRHVQSIHNRLTQFFCKISGADFRTKTSLNTHESVKHVDLNKDPCSVCGKRFSKKNDLTRHMAKTHKIGVEEKQKQYLQQRLLDPLNKFSCQLCPAVYRAQKGLRAHIKIKHEGAKSDPCKLCGNTFSKKSDLARHIRNVHKSYE